MNDASGGRVSGLSTRFIAVAVMGTLVLVAALAGAAVDRLMVRQESAQHQPGPRGGRGEGVGRGGPDRGGRGPGGRGERRRPFDDLLTGDLAVTPAQGAAIDSALEQEGREFEAARAVIQPRIDSILQRTRTRIDAILTPAQRAALPKFTDDGGRGRGRGGRAPGFGPPPDGRGGPPRDGGPGRPGDPRPSPSRNE